VKTLLRSCFVADKADKKELILRNFLHFQQSGLGFEDIEDNVIWNFIVDFVRTHNHVPDIKTLQATFSHRQEDEVLERLESIRKLPSRDEGDFSNYLDLKAEERRKRRVGELLKDAAAILTTGLDVQVGPYKKDKKHLQGPRETIKYILDQGHEIVTPTLGSKLSGEVTEDGTDFVAEYERVEADPTSGVGQWTGLAQMDAVLNGAKRSELWLHAAFTGGLKCVTGETRIWDTLTGALRTAKDIVESGDLPETHGLDEAKWAMVPARADAAAENGIRPIVWLKSEKGRCTRVSTNHPFLTPEGWQDAGSLKAGDWVGVAAVLSNECVSKFSDAEVCLLGYLLGDGTMSDNGLGFTNSNPAILDHFREWHNGDALLGVPEDRVLIDGHPYLPIARRPTAKTDLENPGPARSFRVMGGGRREEVHPRRAMGNLGPAGLAVAFCSLVYRWPSLCRDP
jgi:hypothetical protein